MRQLGRSTVLRCLTAMQGVCRAQLSMEVMTCKCPPLLLADDSCSRWQREGEEARCNPAEGEETRCNAVGGL